MLMDVDIKNSTFLTAWGFSHLMLLVNGASQLFLHDLSYGKQWTTNKH